MTEPELIDDLLNHIAGGNFVFVSKSTDREVIKAIDKAIAYSLVVPDGRLGWSGFGGQSLANFERCV
ncbi:hypothetical protein [uncultured Fibrella sp.]|uniref:hypothetical protein n=1 Tax=uncultured Fibrella sp. TaxID=1284596 RepID=UPI0035CB1459